MTILILILLGLLGVIIIAYLILQRKKDEGGKAYEIEKMLSSTKSGGYSFDVFFQDAYNFMVRLPYVSRYLFKIRKRLEILNNNDEYETRKHSAKITIFSLVLTIILFVVLIYINRSDLYMIMLSVLGVTVLHETIVEMMVNKLEDKILKQQLDLFSEVRHYYHEFGMVDEAIYEASQSIKTEISVQGTAIYEMLVANDSEGELEKYYDVAPNRFLKAFAGVSYLTKEFGDRKVDGASLFLKNVNNITQELQLEIMKRDRIDYIFQSLSIIAIAPLFVMNILKSWALNTFAITQIFYLGKAGRIVEILILLMGFLCYNILRRVKDNSDRVKVSNSVNKRWQQKVYRLPIIEWIVDRLMPVPGTMEYTKQNQLLIDTKSDLKLEGFYVNRILGAIIGFLAFIALTSYLHIYSQNQIYTSPTSDSLSFTALTPAQEKQAKETTTFDNYFIEKYKDKEVTKEEMAVFIVEATDITNKYSTEDAAAEAAERIFEKMDKIKNEYLKPYEVIIAILVGFFGFNVPVILLKFQKKLAELEMENEVMQFQTLILMLMRIERISAEDILEWLERFSNIFRPVISTCLNNFEAGGYRALEQLKDEVSYQPFIKIIEDLQSAVEKIPILDAFDELESERAFFQEKRKEANERLIAKKSIYGKVIGFAPMISLFVGYLIAPLIYVSIVYMGEYLSQMTVYV